MVSEALQQSFWHPLQFIGLDALLWAHSLVQLTSAKTKLLTITGSLTQLVHSKPLVATCLG